MNTPNATHNHIYVVVRLDEPIGDIEKAEFTEVAANYVTMTRAFDSDELATQEAKRLNELNATKDCRYIVRVARMPKG